jgi:hypothetical protein
MEAYIIAGLSLLVSVVVSVMGYLMRDKMESITKKQEQTAEQLRHVEIHYAQKSDMDAIKTEILGRFDRLEDKLNRLT